jgi:hypothetical protein
MGEAMQKIWNVNIDSAGLSNNTALHLVLDGKSVGTFSYEAMRSSGNITKATTATAGKTATKRGPGRPRKNAATVNQ